MSQEGCEPTTDALHSVQTNTMKYLPKSNETARVITAKVVKPMAVAKDGWISQRLSRVCANGEERKRKARLWQALGAHAGVEMATMAL